MNPSQVIGFQSHGFYRRFGLSCNERGELDTWERIADRGEKRWFLPADGVHAFPDFVIPFQILHRGAFFEVGPVTWPRVAPKIETAVCRAMEGKVRRTFAAQGKAHAHVHRPNRQTRELMQMYARRRKPGHLRRNFREFAVDGHFVDWPSTRGEGGHLRAMPRNLP